jgi:hypothetical protein
MGTRRRFLGWVPCQGFGTPSFSRTSYHGNLPATLPTGYSEVIAIITDKSEFVNTAVPWFSFQREIVDRAVLILKDAGVPFLFDRVKKLASAPVQGWLGYAESSNPVGADRGNGD